MKPPPAPESNLFPGVTRGKLPQNGLSVIVLVRSRPCHQIERGLACAVFGVHIRAQPDDQGFSWSLHSVA